MNITTLPIGALEEEDELLSDTDSSYTVVSADLLLHPNLFWKYFLITFFSVIFFFGFFANIFVMITLCGRSLLKSVSNQYFLGLAFVDFFFILSMPFNVVTILIGGWPFGAIICTTYYIVSNMNQFSSSFILVLLAADRYLAVCHSAASIRLRSVCRARIIIICSIFLSVIVSLPTSVFARAIPQLTLWNRSTYGELFKDALNRFSSIKPTTGTLSSNSDNESIMLKYLYLLKRSDQTILNNFIYRHISTDPYMMINLLINLYNGRRNITHNNFEHDTTSIYWKKFEWKFIPYNLTSIHIERRFNSHRIDSCQLFMWNQLKFHRATFIVVYNAIVSYIIPVLCITILYWRIVRKICFINRKWEMMIMKKLITDHSNKGRRSNCSSEQSTSDIRKCNYFHYSNSQIIRNRTFNMNHYLYYRYYHPINSRNEHLRKFLWRLNDCSFFKKTVLMKWIQKKFSYPFPNHTQSISVSNNDYRTVNVSCSPKNVFAQFNFNGTDGNVYLEQNVPSIIKSSATQQENATTTTKFVETPNQTPIHASKEQLSIHENENTNSNELNIIPCTFHKAFDRSPPLENEIIDNKPKKSIEVITDSHRRANLQKYEQNVKYTNIVLEKSLRNRQKARRKVTQTTFTVILVYITCWLPYWLFNFIAMFYANISLLINLKHFCQVLGYANSAINPILYTFLSDSIREVFLLSISRICRLKRK
ncbi:hypothetical protein SNEBB_003878 [Seison nebaliae]|nr:hypothetical protein SNEBB_003878 [Seison nebaliae]